MKTSEIQKIYFCYDYTKIFKRRYRDILQRTSGKTKRTYTSAQHGDIMLQVEFIDWCWTQNNFKIFETLYKEWEKNNFIKKYSPSIDRINSKGTYTLDNIQWLSLSANASKHDS